MKFLFLIIINLSTSLYADKFWVDINFTPNIVHFVTETSLNYVNVKKSIHFKLQARGGGECLACDCGYPQNSFSAINILSGYHTSSKYLNFSILGGLGLFNYTDIVILDKTNFKWESNGYRTISFPIEMEFIADLRYIGVGIGVYAQINSIETYYGIKLIFLLGYI